MKGKHEAPSTAPRSGEKLHIPLDVRDEASRMIAVRVAEYLRANPVTVVRTIGGVSYTWTFDRLELSGTTFGDNIGTVR